MFQRELYFVIPSCVLMLFGLTLHSVVASVAEYNGLTELKVGPLEPIRGPNK